MSQPWNERELDKRFDELKAEIKRLEAALTVAESRAQAAERDLDGARSLNRHYAKWTDKQDALIGRLRAALEGARIRHLVVEGDCWFSCPKSGECCDNSRSPECDCGADAHNARIDAVLLDIFPRPAGETSRDS